MSNMHYFIVIKYMYYIFIDTRTVQYIYKMFIDVPTVFANRCYRCNNCRIFLYAWQFSVYDTSHQPGKDI